MLLIAYTPLFFGGEQAKPKAQLRSLPKTVIERRQLAWRLCSVPELDDEKIETLRALGHVAVPAMIAARNGAQNKSNILDRLIVGSALPSDTKAIYKLSLRFESSSGDGSTEDSPLFHIFGRWLIQRGDPEFLAPRYLPDFLGKRDFSRQATYLPCLLRSRNSKVVDTLFGMLKSPSTDHYIRQNIGEGIAQCKRPDVLDWLTTTRPSARKRSKPNLELSGDRDFDGDGLPDNLDINPYAAPRSLTEEECVLQIAFESQMRFQANTDCLASIEYPNGYSPFELHGLDGTLVPLSRLSEKESLENVNGAYKYWHLGMEIIAASPKGEPLYGRRGDKKVRLPSGATRAFVSFSMVGAPLGGAGFLIELQKIRGKWFTVGASQQWIS